MINEQQTQTPQPQVSAPAPQQEPMQKRLTPLQEQQQAALNPRRSVFLADERMVVNTSLNRAQDVRFAIDTELYKKAKDNYFAYYRLDESVPDTTARLWKVPFRAVGNAGVSMWQAAERTVAGSVGFAGDWMSRNRQIEKARIARYEALRDLTAGGEPLTVEAANRQAQQKTEIEQRYQAQMQQIEADYEYNRQLGRNALLIMRENHQHFREQAGLEKNENDGFIYDLFNAGGSLAAAIGLTVLTGSPAAAAIAFGSTAGQQDYEEALKNGVSPNRALLAGVAGGVYEGGIELLGMEMLFKSLTRTGVLGRIAAAALSEGTEEAAQQTAEEIIMQNYGGRSQEMGETLKGIGYSFVLGALTAAPVAVLVNRASNELQEKGIPKEQADKMAVKMAQAVSTPENKQAVHDILSNATSPLNYREGDIIKGAQDFKQAVDTARNPDRKTRREIYNVAEREEEAARREGLDEDTVQMVGQVAQTRANLVFNEANLKPGEQIKLTEVRFENEQKAQPQPQPDATYEQQRQAYLERKAAEERQAAEEADRKLAEANLPDDFDFSLSQEAYDNTGKTKTDSPAFKEWFGDSKVVSEQGQPLVVYHNTDAQFAKFDKSKIGTKTDHGMHGRGFYFSSEKGQTYMYGNRQMPVYLAIKNPLRLGKNGQFEDIHDYGNAKKGIPSINSRADYEKYKDQLPSIEEITEMAKQDGYDGIIVKPLSGAKDEYIVFEPTQIKSVNNRGTFDPSSANIYYQETGTAQDERNLAVVHNISASALSKAIDLGGFPAPSIAVINKDQPFYVGGEITLVGSKEMIDPARPANEVYNRDIWSKTFPQTEYKRTTSKARDAFRKKYEPYFERTQDRGSLSSVLYTAQASNPGRAISEFDKTLAAKVAYLENVQGEKVDIELKDRSLEIAEKDLWTNWGFHADEQFLTDAKAAFKYAPGLERKRLLTQAVAAAFDRADYSANGDMAAKLKEEMYKNIFEENGQLTWKAHNDIEYTVGKYLAERGTLTVDRWALREQLDKQIKNMDAYYDWTVKAMQDDLLGEPLVRVGRTLKPFTLENVTRAMISGTTKNAEEALIFGTGKVVAAGAKRLRSLAEIKAESKKLLTPKNAMEQMDLLTNRVLNFANEVSKIGSHGFHDTVSRGEAAMRALATVADSKKPSAAALQKALNYELANQETYDQKLLDKGVQIAQDVRELSRDYFEAKPQRAVGLKEFTGAIIPTNNKYDEVAKKVEAAGLRVIRSDNQTEALGLFNDTFFQAAYNGSPHQFDKFSLSAIGTGEGNAAHGWGLYFAKDKKVADDYRKYLSIQSIEYDGKAIADDKARGYLENMLLQIKDPTTAKLRAAVSQYIKEFEQDIQDAKADLQNPELKYKWNNAKWQIENYTARIKMLKSFDPEKLELKQGQLYKVEIPSEDELLDEQKLLKDQPEKVQDAIYELAQDHPALQNMLDEGASDTMTGWDIYHVLAQEFQTVEDDDYNTGHSQSGMRDASITLNEYGIKGITYEGAQDGRCYVVFDDNAVRTLETFYQDVEPLARGSVTFDRKANQAVIKAFKNADPSTVVHEVAHVLEHDMLRAEQLSNEEEFLQTMRELRSIYADSAEWALNWVKTTNLFSPATRTYMLNEIQKRGGQDFIVQFAKEGDLVNTTNDVEIVLKHAFSERFATQFEAYLKNGKAPNETYKGLFEKFAQWLREIYNSVAGKMELDPKVQAFFDKIMTRQAAKLDSKVFSGKIAKIKEQVANVNRGNAVGDFTLEQLQAFVDLADSRAPRLPDTHLLKELRRYGAEYNNAGRIDAESFKNARIFNKKGGVGDDPARWLMEHGYMASTGDGTQLTYEDVDRLNEQAYDMIERAMDGEIIYPAGTEQQVAEYENYKELMDTFREVFGTVAEAKKTAKAILTLREKGYRVVERKDLSAMSLRLAELDRLAENLQNKSATERKKENAEAAINARAQKIIDRVVEQLEKREIEGKDKLIKKLKAADTFVDKQTALNEAFRFLEDAYAKTAEGQQEQRKIDVPRTNWDGVRTQILKAATEILGDQRERAKKAEMTLARLSVQDFLNEEQAKQKEEATRVLEQINKKLNKKFVQQVEHILSGISHLGRSDVQNIVGRLSKNLLTRTGMNDAELDGFIFDPAQRIQMENYEKFMTAKINAVLSRKPFERLASNNTKRAKFTVDAMNFLASAKDDWNCTLKDAKDRYGQEMQAFAGETKDTPPDLWTVLRRRLLELRTVTPTRQGIAFSEYMKQLNQRATDFNEMYNTLLSVVRQDRNLKRMEGIRKKVQEDNMRVLAVDALENRKGFAGLQTYLLRGGTDLQTMLSMLFGKNTMDEYDPQTNEMRPLTVDFREEFAPETNQIEEANFKAQATRDILATVGDAYGLKNQFQILDKIAELEKDEMEITNYGYVHDQEAGELLPVIFKNKKPVTTNKPMKQKINRLQIMTFWIWDQNHDFVETPNGTEDYGLHGRLERAYGQTQLNAMFSKLTDEDLQAARNMQALAAKHYDAESAVHKRIYGFSLPQVDFYFPSKTERITDTLDLKQEFVTNSKAPSFIKQRVQSRMPVQKIVNPIDVLSQHLRRAGEFIYNAEKYAENQRIFKHKDVQAAFVNKFGDDKLYNKFMNLLAMQAPQGQQAKDEFHAVSNKLMNGWVKAVMGLKLITGIKQFASSVSFAENMPAATWTKYFCEGLANPLETAAYMKKLSPYIQTRYEQGGMNEAVARAMADDEVSPIKHKWNSLTNLALLNTRLGDKASLIYGGYPYMKYLIEEKKMKPQEAARLFEKQATRTLQSSLRVHLSEGQAAADNLPARLFLVFKNQQLQYLRKVAEAITAYRNGEMTALQAGKIVFLYTVLNPAVYTVLGMGWLADDDDDRDEDLKRLLTSPITQTAGAYPFGEGVADFMIDNAVSLWTEGKMTGPRRTSLAVFDDIYKDAAHLVKTVNADDIELKEFLGCFFDAAKYTGLPTQTIANTAMGAYDVTQGEFVRGGMRLAGYTKRRAEKVTGSED